MGIFDMSIWQDNADHFAQRPDPVEAARMMHVDVRAAIRMIRAGAHAAALDLMVSSVANQARVGYGIGCLQLGKSAATRPASEGVVVPMQRGQS
jgi:hypothetical protein